MSEWRKRNLRFLVPDERPYRVSATPVPPTYEEPPICEAEFNAATRQWRAEVKDYLGLPVTVTVAAEVVAMDPLYAAAVLRDLIDPGVILTKRGRARVCEILARRGPSRPPLWR